MVCYGTRKVGLNRKMSFWAKLLRFNRQVNMEHKHCDHHTSMAAHSAFSKTCPMLVYLFYISCLFSINSYCMYKRTTADIEGEVVHVKLV